MHLRFLICSIAAALVLTVSLTPVDWMGLVIAGPGGSYGFEQHHTGPGASEKLTVLWLGPLHFAIYLPLTTFFAIIAGIGILGLAGLRFYFSGFDAGEPNKIE